MTRQREAPRADPRKKVMTRIADLLACDPAGPAQETVPAGNDDPDAVFRELAEFVATDRIKAEYERLFSALGEALKSPDEDVGIWISGPLGSGKSAFANNLGYVLGNRDVRGSPAAALFVNKLGSRQVAEQVEFINRSIPYQIFPVTLRAELAVETHAEHFVEAMYRALLRGLDYDEDYDIAGLEIELEKEGQFASFQALCRTEYHQEWRDVRSASQKFACASSLLHRLSPHTYHSTDAWLKAIRARPARSPSAKDLVEKAFELCAFRHPGKTFAFLVDEIGPYATLGGERVENLRAVVEEFGRESLLRLKAGKIPGPIWIVVTAQETLQEVSNHLAASRIARPKLEDHFKHHIELSADDIREVVARRVLGKKESQEPGLRKAFRDSGEALIRNIKLERCSRRSELDEPQFVQFYPYLPHLIDLTREILGSIRLHPDRPRQLGGNLPTIIRHSFDMLFSARTRIADQPFGALVSIDQIHDLLESNIPLEKRKEIGAIRQRFDNHERHPGIAGRVAKAICLMQFVKADLPRTTHNIAALLIQNISEEPPTFAVATILQELKEAEFVQETEGGWTLYDFDELRRRAAALKDLRNAVRVINPRLPGWHNDMIQTAKKALARFLSWYTRPLYEFNASVSRSLEEVVRAVDHLTSSLVALDQGSLRKAFDYLPVNMVGLEEQLAQLDPPNAPVAESMRANVALLRQQVKVLGRMQKTVNLEAPAGGMEKKRGTGAPQDSHLFINQFPDQGKPGMQWGRNESRDRTAYVIGLFGTGRRYINELLIENIGERAKYFRDGIRLHPGPTPMIYSGHVTTKYPSRAQELPVVMKYIMESVKAGDADSIFICRHPLDSLLTNWVWWRTYARDNRSISGISEVYQNKEDLCADLKKNFLEFKSFAEGDSDFFVATPGPRFLSFSEFVEETELHLQSSPLTLRLEDFMIDPLKEFSKIAATMSADLNLNRLSLAPPRTKASGHLAVKERVPEFRGFIDELDTETKARLAKIGYGVSG
jgi:hypothetical protein